MDNYLNYTINEFNDFDELNDKLDIEELMINNRNINEINISIINKLTNLKSLFLINCDVENLELLECNIEKLYIDSCDIENLPIINNYKLKELFLENMDTIDLEDYSLIRNIESLSFTNTKIKNAEKLIFMDKIINLDLFNSGINDLSIFINMDTLKTLVIDEKTAINNKDIVEILINNGVNVVNDSNQSVVMYYE